MGKKFELRFSLKFYLRRWDTISRGLKIGTIGLWPSGGRISNETLFLNLDIWFYYFLVKTIGYDPKKRDYLKFVYFQDSLPLAQKKNLFCLFILLFGMLASPSARKAGKNSHLWNAETDLEKVSEIASSFFRRTQINLLVTTTWEDLARW